MMFARYIGVDYSGAQTPNDSLKGLRVYLATPARHPEEVHPPPSAKRYWTRRGLAEWLGDLLEGEAPTIIGIDHGFSFPLDYFERHGLMPDWYRFLQDFRKHWPTHEDFTYVDFLRDGPRATGKARQGDTRWRRLTELAAGSAKSVFHFDVQGSVAKSTHSGIPWLLYLKERLGERIHIWPFDGWAPPPGKHVLVEAYPRLFSSQFPLEDRNGDQHDAFAVSAWLQARDADGSLGSYFEPALAPDHKHSAAVEGWIIGLMNGPVAKAKPARKANTKAISSPHFAPGHHRQVVLIISKPELHEAIMGTVESLGDKPLRLLFASELVEHRVRKEFVSAAGSTVLIADVTVETVNREPYAYRVISVQKVDAT